MARERQVTVHAVGGRPSHPRAAQGHSRSLIDLDLPATEPPAELFHGTGQRQPRRDLGGGASCRAGRRHVHLSADAETATHVGQRHGKPVVLRIAIGRMHADGHPFGRADNRRLANRAVDPAYLRY